MKYKNKKWSKYGVWRKAWTGFLFFFYYYYLLLYFILSSPPPAATRQTADSSAVFINTLQTISSFGDPPVNVVPPPGICSETRFEQEVSLGAKLLIKKNGCNNVSFLERNIWQWYCFILDMLDEIDKFNMIWRLTVIRRIICKIILFLFL